MKTKIWASAALSARALLPAGAILMLVAGCSLLPGEAGKGGDTSSSGSSHSGQTNEDEATMLVVGAVESSSNDISSVEVGRGVDGLAKYMSVNVTMTGDQVTSAQIVEIVAAVTGTVPDGFEQIYLGVWEPAGPTEINIAAQGKDLGVPDVYVLDDYTLVMPLEWLQQEYGDPR